MKRNLRKVIASLAALACTALPAYAQPRPGTGDLPIKQVVLFSSGVAYYQREGQVDGNSRIDLSFQMDDINDLLKSLVLEDRAGGQIATVTYDNRKPVDLTLKAFAIDLTRNPSMGDLLNQVRGEQVEVLTTVDPKAAVGQTENITGIVVGVEKQRQPLGKDQFIEVAQLNMLTKDGLRGIPLGQVQRVRFSKQGLDQEFRKALEVLATSHDKQKKTVSLNFNGDGKRSVKVGYVCESPIWKTSYRLSLAKKAKKEGEDKDKETSKEAKEELILQGWAVVENTTDDDWNSVQLGLVSGRPISFKMDLYTPLFVDRPEEKLDLFASLRPQTYEGNMLADLDAVGADRPSAGDKRGADGKGEGQGNGRGLAERGKAAGLAFGAGKPMDMAPKMQQQMAFRKDAATAATATELGEFFQYVIKQPVSLPRQKSALLPIVNDEVKGRKVSIFNENVHKKFPLLGLKFTNSTSLHLCQGPITVFEDSTYAGDAKIGDLQPKETRLLSYAIDLGTEVDAQFKESEDLLKVKLVKGLIQQDFLRKEFKTYKIKNRSEHTRTMLIEHPYRPQFKLMVPEKASEQARNVYRFEVKCEPNKPIEYVVEEQLPHFTQVALSNSNDESIRILMRSNAASVKVKEAMGQALVLRGKVSDVQTEIARDERDLKAIEADQARMRENMKALPPTSKPFLDYVEKYGAQEKQIEKLRANIKKLNDTLDSNRRAFDSFLADLNID